MARLVNPYIAGNPVGNSTAFFGRDDVLEAVLAFPARANNPRLPHGRVSLRRGSKW